MEILGSRIEWREGFLFLLLVPILGVLACTSGGGSAAEYAADIQMYDDPGRGNVCYWFKGYHESLTCVHMPEVVK